MINRAVAAVGLFKQGAGAEQQRLFDRLQKPAPIFCQRRRQQIIAIHAFPSFTEYAGAPMQTAYSANFTWILPLI
ncbi:MAG: hypothetical protein ACJ8GW_20580 [Massilia sp.]